MGDGATKTRLELRREQGIIDEVMPEVNNGFYLVGWLNKLGNANYGFNGVIPLTSIDVQAWASMSRRDVNPWEFETLITLSRQYCAQMNASGKKGCEAPFAAEITNDDMIRVRDKAEDKLRSLF